MKIAVLAPFEEPVPPKKYGGTERVVYRLVEELVAMGHEVTLLASGDSDTSAKLIPCVNRAIRVLPEARVTYTRQALSWQGLAKALQAVQDGHFDILHNHYGWQALLFQKLVNCPIITTLHGTLDKAQEPTEHHMFNHYRDAPLVSISRSQRHHAPKLNYVSTIYNGISVDRFDFDNNPDDYLVFLGRIHPQKGPEQAIKIAKKTGHRLIIAAKVDPMEEKYFNRTVRPLIDDKQIIFLGEVEHARKVKLLKKAKALLSPLQWDEPFGITNIEAMACGTPVIAINRGSMPEIIKDGKVGFLCKNINEMVHRVSDIPKIQRQNCREHVEQNFTARHMANGYLEAYRQVIEQVKPSPKRRTSKAYIKSV